MNINKFHLAIILKLSSIEKMLKTFDKMYFTTNSIYHCQHFYNYQAINTQKNLAVMEKYQIMLNINAKIGI